MSNSQLLFQKKKIGKMDLTQRAKIAEAVKSRVRDLLMPSTLVGEK